MVDIPGNSTTTASIGIGAIVENSIETVGDHDWFRIFLTAGQKVSIAVNLITLEDSYVYMRNASGAVLAENDDGGGGRGSRLVFTAPTSGTYYVDVAAWAPTESIPGYTGTGAYRLSVTNYVAPGVGTLDEIANQMTHGFFDGASHHFDVTQGGTITVDLTAITASGRAVALKALQQWSDIIGVSFVEQSGNAQITFDDLEQGTGAFANTVHANGITSSAIVNVSLQRLNLHTYMHEIGHALGLGHTSNSNAGTAGAVYPDDALWSNDGAAISIMSYFDNGENVYYSSRGFSHVPIMTPQVADIIAIGNLYGLSTTTRTGNTTYGFNNTSGNDGFDATLNPKVAYTIFDSAGLDTLDYSGFANNQLIDLNPEAFSNVGAAVGNVVIARGTIIENARGGSGADVMHGNGADNWLRGGAGNDVLNGNDGDDTLDGGLDADTLVGGAGNDRIIYDSADNPAAVSGGSGFDYLLIFNQEAPLGYDLLAGGFDAAERTVADNGLNSWKSVFQSFTETWALRQQMIDNDDGSRNVIDYDFSNASPTSFVWSTIDASNRLWSVDTHFDSGARTFVDFDVLGRSSWSQIWYSFDSLGGLDSVDLLADDGTRTFINHDQDNLHGWSQAWFVYDAQGRLDTQHIIHDDSSSIFYNFDQTGAEAFQWHAYLYDPSGIAYQQVVRWDDGTTAYYTL